MTEHTDSDSELLSSLMDGELAASEAEALERRLANEPLLAQQLAAMRRAEQKLRAAYAPLADEPLPADLVALLSDADQDNAPADANVVPFPQAAPSRSFFVPSSIAAGIALAVGIGIGLSLDRDGGLSETERLLAANVLISPETELFAVLETSPSGATTTLDGGVEATPRLSFQTAAGNYCREATVATRGRESALVGCREDAGWALQAVIQVSANSIAADIDGFRPASVPTSALDGVVDRLIEGAPLGTDAENAAIAAGWK
jgi:hypothetical protein